MKQEMNNKMEQNSKENEVTKNEVAETEAMPCNATNTATANTTTLQRTITVPSNAITIQSFASQFFESGGTLVESGTAIAGRKDNLYHYAICTIDVEKVSKGLKYLLEQGGSATLTIDAAHYEGLDVCVFLTQTQNLFTWEDGREIAFELNDAYSNGSIMFIVAPATPQSNGYITFTPADMTLSYNFSLSSINNITYIPDSNNEKHTMDIHFRGDLVEGVRLPAVITIHGGSWAGGNKDYYDYMTEFITDTCNCVHVNINYRVTKNDNGEPTGFTYEDMLDDIQLVIKYLNDHSAVYHVDTSKIALMGHSAGGHLALLYAYSTADNYTNQEENPIKLVISEAGPTYFYKENEDLTGQDEIITDENICAMVGIDYKGENYVYQHKNEEHLNYQEDLEDITALWNASPLKYVNNNSPYTILAYGNGLSAEFDNYEGDNGDDTIPYSQATALEEVLNFSSSQVGGGTGDNASQIIEGDNCTLFKLFGVGHGEFGEGGKVYPNTTYDDEQGINQIIYAYYDKILNKLQALAQQED